MKPPPIPPDEAERQASLDQLDALDTPAEERFDRITRLARKLFDVPIALITLVDHDRQWFKSAQGLAVAETPREVSFCGHAIVGEAAFVVTDAAVDERFTDNPLVVGDPEIRFYAGQPLRAPDGRRVGTLCVIDRRPRSISESDLQALYDLAALTEDELRVSHLSAAQRELRARLASAERRAALDGLTRVWSRSSVLELLGTELARSHRARLPLALVMLDLDGFKPINDAHGHPIGDVVLGEAAARVRRELRRYDVIGRYGGDEFLVVLLECGAKTAEHVTERIRSRIAATPVLTAVGPIRVEASLGCVLFDGTSPPDADALLRAADRALHRAKREGGNRVEQG